MVQAQTVKVLYKLLVQDNGLLSIEGTVLKTTHFRSCISSGEGMTIWLVHGKAFFKGGFRTHQIGHERAWTVVRAMLKDRRVIQMKADAAKGTLDVTLAS